MAETSFEKQVAIVTAQLDGNISCAETTRRLYATDASIYQQLPRAVAFPRSSRDIGRLVDLARKTGVPLTPRAAGTSLAGQATGGGIIVDVSRYMTRLIHFDVASRQAVVEPGLVRDELNRALAKHDLMFAPETSTSNRATLGGMFGNNSCGANSIAVGTTRDHIIGAKGYLGSGEFADFCEIPADEVDAILGRPPRSVEETLLHQLTTRLNDPDALAAIAKGYPHRTVTRRNTGYALDWLVQRYPFRPDGGNWNLAPFLAGSEGTLFFATEIRLRLQKLPAPCRGLYCPHFDSVDDALRAAPLVMRHHPYNCELIDRRILEGARQNRELAATVAQFDGLPEALLLVEVRAATDDDVAAGVDQIAATVSHGVPVRSARVFTGDDVERVHQLRRAGLGLAQNVTGPVRPVTIIEDAAVSVDQLADFTHDVREALERHGVGDCVYYGHAGAGELHLRPLFDMRSSAGRQLLTTLGSEIAALVLKYQGALSGEHGDGRLRGPWLESVLGRDVCELLRYVKSLFDPDTILNPGKVLDSPPVDSDLRDHPTQVPLMTKDRGDSRPHETMFRFAPWGGIQPAAEQCTGVGACRKSVLAGGVMCPSYHATGNELHSTRGRANIVRQVLTGALAGDDRLKSVHDDQSDTRDRLSDTSVKEALMFCLSCKACKSECPSNVDMAKIKSECLHADHVRNGARWSDKAMARIPQPGRLLRGMAPLLNTASSLPGIGTMVKRIAGFHPKRSIPPIARHDLRRWHSQRNRPNEEGKSSSRQVLFFCDEFTNLFDFQVGRAAIELLEGLGYTVTLYPHAESGRAAISLGFLDVARTFAELNVRSSLTALEALPADVPIVGVEPSSVLTLRDEYPDLVGRHLQDDAVKVADRVLLIDEFLSHEMADGRVTSAAFHDESKSIWLHGHCHQRALSDIRDTLRILQLPRNYEAQLIRSGCCGMAGSFGYHRATFDLSMAIGEQVLFPTIRKIPESALIAANGTSCRHQILDGTDKRALHPVEILRAALR